MRYAYFMRTIPAAIPIAGILGAPEAKATDYENLIGKTFGGALEPDDVTVRFTVTNLANTRQQGVSVGAPFCRVRWLITSAPHSDVNFEVWLPPAPHWNSKYQGVGNGALGAFRRSRQSNPGKQLYLRNTAVICA
jgi:hypothetical protein